MMYVKLVRYLSVCIKIFISIRYDLYEKFTPTLNLSAENIFNSHNNSMINDNSINFKIIN